MLRQRAAFILVLLVIAYFTVGPLSMLVYGSLRSGPPGVPSTWTLGPLEAVFTSANSYRLMGYSLVYALLASLVSFVLGGFMAWVTERTNTPLRKLTGLLLYLPVFVPTVLITLSWTMLLAPRSGLFNVLAKDLLGLANDPINIFTFAGMVWVKGLIDVPLVHLWLTPAFRNMDPSLEEAGMMAGTTTAGTFRRITLPLALPALLAAWLIAFVLALEDLAVPIFLGIPAKVMVYSSEIWMATRRVPSDINLASAYAVPMLMITLLGIVVYRRVTRMANRFATVTGKGYRPRVLDLGPWRYVTMALSLMVMMVTVLMPLGILFWNSLMPFPQVPSFEAMQSLTLEHYRSLAVGQRNMGAGLQNSLVLGLVSGVAVMLFSAVVSWFVVRSRVRGREWADFLGFLPIAIPGVVVGISLIWVYLTLDVVRVYGTIWIILIAYFTRFLPYGLRLGYAGFSQIHPQLEEVGYVSGGTWTHVFRRITLPLLSPAMIVGICYILLRAFRELPASMLLATGDSPVFSVVVYGLWESGSVGRVGAYGSVAIVVLFTVVFAVQRLARQFGTEP